MNPKESPEITVKTLLALRLEGDALRIITDKLRVKEMGPADHIRTKHEVKQFVESGDPKFASDLLQRAVERRGFVRIQSVTEKMKVETGRRITP